MRPVALLALLFPLSATAEPAVTRRLEPEAPREEVRNWGNLRVGGALGAGEGRPELCGEFAPLAFLAVEACGTGAGILHDDPIDQAMHVRAKLRLLRFAAGEILLEPLVGAGLIELQLGEDDPGFRFGDTGPRGVETAGVEVMGGLRALFSLGAGFELIGELSGGVGYTPHAPELIRPMTRTPVFGALTVGVGF